MYVYAGTYVHVSPYAGVNVQTHNNPTFLQIIVRDGGHILPFDQPERAWDMIDRFITGRPFN